MSSQGPLSPGTLANVDNAGGPAWVNPGNAAASDDSRAIVTFTAGSQTSDYLAATNYGFAIPANALVTGIVVEIERSESASDDNVRDSNVQLTKDGSALVGAGLVGAGEWPIASDVYETYGSSSNLWGATWTPSEINASTFGVFIAAQCIAGTTSDARIDHVRITVYYDEPHSGWGVPL